MAPNAAALNKLILRLEVTHVIFGGLSFGRVMYYTALTAEESGQSLSVPGKLLFFLLVSFMMLVVSVLMFLACLVESQCEEGKKPYKSLFEVALYGFGNFLYLAAVLSLILHLVEDNGEDSWSLKRASFIGAAMFACWNAINYLLSLWAFVKLRSLVRLEIKDSDSAVLLG